MSVSVRKNYIPLMQKCRNFSEMYFNGSSTVGNMQIGEMKMAEGWKAIVLSILKKTFPKSNREYFAEGAYALWNELSLCKCNDVQFVLVG